MSAVEPLFRLLGMNVSHLNKEESNLLEAELFARICEHFIEIQRNKYKSYFQLIHLNKEKEQDMLNSLFIRAIIDDLLAEETYTLQGIATYTDTAYDTVEEIYQGRIANPSILFFWRLIELHRYVCRQVYSDVLQKILAIKGAV